MTTPPADGVDVPLGARVVQPEEIVITSRGAVVARLVPPRATAGREFGWDAGRLVVPDDFDEPLPEDVLRSFDA